MWSKGKVGAVSMAERSDALSPPIFRNPARRLGASDRFWFSLNHDNLNRQTHEFKNAVTFRKQTTAICSSRQKTQKSLCTFLASVGSRVCVHLSGIGGLRANPLKQERDERPTVAPVSLVLGPECFGHGPFFHADFPPVRQRHNRQRNGRVNLSGHDGCAEIHSEHRGVNRMAYEPVRTSPYQLMSRRDSDLTAPIAAQMPSGPDREKNKSGCDHKAGRYDELTVGKESSRQPWNGKNEQQHSSVDQSQMQPARPLRFRRLRRRAVLRCNTPVNRKETQERYRYRHPYRKSQSCSNRRRYVPTDIRPHNHGYSQFQRYPDCPFYGHLFAPRLTISSVPLIAPAPDAGLRASLALVAPPKSLLLRFLANLVHLCQRQEWREMNLIRASGVQTGRGTLRDKIGYQAVNARGAGSMRSVLHYDYAAVAQIFRGLRRRFRWGGWIERAGHQQRRDGRTYRRGEVLGDGAANPLGAGFLVHAHLEVSQVCPCRIPPNHGFRRAGNAFGADNGEAHPAIYLLVDCVPYQQDGRAINTPIVLIGAVNHVGKFAAQPRNVQQRPQSRHKHAARERDRLGSRSAVIDVEMSRSFFQAVHDGLKLFLQIREIFIAGAVGRTSSDQLIDRVLGRLRKCERNSIVRRRDRLQSDGADVISVHPQVHESGERAVRTAENVDLVIAHRLPHVVEVIRGDGRGVQSEVGLFFKFGAASPHLFRDYGFADHLLCDFRIAQLAQQRIRFAGAALVHQHRVALLSYLSGVARQGVGFDGTLAWTPGNGKPRVGGRLVGERRQHHDVQRDLAPALLRAVLEDFVLSAQAFGVAVGRAAGLKRNASDRSRFDCGLGCSRTRTMQRELQRIATLLPSSNELASVVAELSFVTCANAFQLEPQARTGRKSNRIDRDRNVALINADELAGQSAVGCLVNFDDEMQTGQRALPLARNAASIRSLRFRDLLRWVCLKLRLSCRARQRRSGQQHRQNQGTHLPSRSHRTSPFRSVFENPLFSGPFVTKRTTWPDRLGTQRRGAQAYSLDSLNNRVRPSGLALARKAGSTAAILRFPTAAGGPASLRDAHAKTPSPVAVSLFPPKRYLQQKLETKLQTRFSLGGQNQPETSLSRSPRKGFLLLQRRETNRTFGGSTCEFLRALPCNRPLAPAGPGCARPTPRVLRTTSRLARTGKKQGSQTPRANSDAADPQGSSATATQERRCWLAPKPTPLWDWCNRAAVAASGMRPRKQPAVLLPRLQFAPPPR